MLGKDELDSLLFGVSFSKISSFLFFPRRNKYFTIVKVQAILVLIKSDKWGLETQPIYLVEL